MYGNVRYFANRVSKRNKKNIINEIEQIIANYEQRINEDIIGKNYIPANIELQIKTAKVAKKAISGKASHYGYKGEDPEEIISRYNENPESFIIGENLPIMWCSDVDENGKGIIRLLNLEEVAKIVHPYLEER